VTEREELREIVSSLKDAVKRGGRAVGARKAPAKASPAVTPAAPAGLPARPATAAPPVARTVAPAPARLPSDLLGAPPPPTGDYLSDPAFSPEEKLRRLRQDEIGDCQRCPLGKSRIKLAFGVGNPRAKIMVIGEGPGYQEDRQGQPFVGPAGQLLDKILDSVGLSRAEKDPSWSWVYIANMVKCHPMIDPSDNTKRGNDRPPTPEEMAVCSPFLMKQIRIIRPLFIVALGATAGKGLLKTELGISKFRGQWTAWSPEGEPGLQVRLLPTYHPAALLRNPALKKDVWEDMKSLRAELHKAVGAA
jgi:DNA polymerase